MTLRTLQLFDHYLPLTESWLYRLLRNVPDVEVAVAATEFWPTNFYTEKFDYIQFPVRMIEGKWAARTPLARLANKVIAQAYRAYPAYVGAVVGDVDVMHSHFATAGWRYRGLARKLDAPHVVSFYGFDYESLPNRVPVWRKRFNDVFKRADAVLCEGRFGASQLEALGCPADRLRVQHLGVEVDKVAFRAREKRPGELRLLQVANFVEKKGHDDALAAFELALADCPQMSMTFIGGGDRVLRAALEKTLASSPARARVAILDPVPLDKIYELMAQHHVLIHPSRYAKDRDCEGGAPVVLLDAQVTGMPVISTTHCDIPDEVSHGKSGLLTPERDRQALASSIRRFYAMNQLQYDEMARAARAHVERNYDVRRCAESLREIYQDVAASRRSCAAGNGSGARR